MPLICKRRHLGGVFFFLPQSVSGCVVAAAAVVQTQRETLKPCTENILAYSPVLQRRSDTNGGGDNEIDEQRRVSVSGPPPQKPQWDGRSRPPGRDERLKFSLVCD